MRSKSAQQSRMIDQFCNWLAGAPVSQAFQDLRWFVPTVQTVHILCIAVIMIGRHVGFQVAGPGGTCAAVVRHGSELHALDLERVGHPAYHRNLVDDYRAGPRAAESRVPSKKY
jgi:hypothetical protein